MLATSVSLLDAAGRWSIRLFQTLSTGKTWHGPTEHRTEVALDAGEHEIVVEHFEIDGYAVLRFDLRPAK